MRKFCLSLIAMLMVALYANAWKFTVESPAEGEVTEINEIVLINPVGQSFLDEDYSTVTCTMYCPNDRTVTYTFKPDQNRFGYQVGTTEMKLNTPGEYTLKISKNQYHFDSLFSTGEGCEDMTFTWTIGGGGDQGGGDQGGGSEVDYNLSVSSSIANGTVSVSRNLTKAKEGDEITLNPSANDGYVFGSWNVTANGNPVTVSNNRFTMPAGDVTISANFIKTYLISISSIENGSVSVSGNLERAKAGDVVTLNASPNSGYEFDSWNVIANGTPIAVTDNKFTMPASDVTISATFVEASIPQCEIAYSSRSITITWPVGTSVSPYYGGLSIEGYEGAVNPFPQSSVGDFNYNMLRISADLEDGEYAVVIPSEAYYINGVLNPYTRIPFTVGSVKYSLNVSPSIVNGTVSISDDLTEAKEGDEITLTATADPGYELDSWNVTASGATVPVTNNKFTMPAADVTISANFVIKYTIAVVPAENGTISASVARAKEGDVITLSPNADAGYKLDSWNVTANGTPIMVTNNKFTMPAADVTVSATFVEVEGIDLYYDAEGHKITVTWPAGTTINELTPSVSVSGYSYYWSFVNPDGSNVLRSTYFNIENDGDYTLTINAGSYSIDGVPNETIVIPFTVGNPNAIDIEISSALYATFVPGADVDITTNSDVEAYIVTSVHDGYIKLKQTEQVPANNAVIVKANAAGTYSVERMSGAELSGHNELKVSNGQYVNVENRYYILANGANGVGFYPVKMNTNITANKGYLEITNGVGAKSYAFGFDDIATDIQGVVFDKLDGSREIYDLQGRRLQQMKRGINIINGKKVIK